MWDFLATNWTKVFVVVVVLGHGRRARHRRDASFYAIMFVLCVGYGLAAPERFHAAWFLEAVLPGFTWLTVSSFVLGVIETALYGALAGLLYTRLYNYFVRRADRSSSRRVTAARAA